MVLLTPGPIPDISTDMGDGTILTGLAGRA